MDALAKQPDSVVEGLESERRSIAANLPPSKQLSHSPSKVDQIRSKDRLLPADRRDATPLPKTQNKFSNQPVSRPESKLRHLDDAVPDEEITLMEEEIDKITNTEANLSESRRPDCSQPRLPPQEPAQRKSQTFGAKTEQHCVEHLQTQVPERPAKLQDRDLEFYPTHSERSRLNNQSQLHAGGPLPSETSTTNLLMYSQSVNINDVESTLHAHNQSMAQSEFDPKVVERFLAQESERLRLEFNKDSFPNMQSPFNGALPLRGDQSEVSKFNPD
jgi:hypothetical protein